MVPSFREDGGDEAEIAGGVCYRAEGTPYRIGSCSETSFPISHGIEKLSLPRTFEARQCAIARGGLIVGGVYADVPGRITIDPRGQMRLASENRQRRKRMCHSTGQTWQHHHFKYEAHRGRADVHIHFLQAPIIQLP